MTTGLESNKEKKYDNYDKNNNNILSVMEAINILENGKVVKVRGNIVSLTSLYKVITRSEWVCENIRCNFTGSQDFNPPLLLPNRNYDSILNGYDETVSCKKCESNTLRISHTYMNARIIQLEDSRDSVQSGESKDNNSFDDHNNNNDRLEVILYSNAETNIIAGELVEIEGRIYVQRKVETGSKAKKLVNILHADNLIYKNREKIVITSEDIENFLLWKKVCDEAYKKELDTVKIYKDEPWRKKIVPMSFIDRVVSMFSPNVIGHDDAKLGILRSIVGGNNDTEQKKEDNGRRGRIHTFLVGDPGTAKSILAREGTRILPNSRYVTMQNASGKSLIGIVDRENDSLVLRLGVVVLSKNSICAANEISSLSFEDQGHVIDILEEGRCTLDKFGIHYEIDSPTTIIATGNPIGISWKNSIVSKDEIPVVKNLLDRFDQIYVSKDNITEEELIEYTKRKTVLRKRRYHNYNFLKKYLNYVKSNVKPKITDNTENRLNKFWTNAKIEGVATNRSYDSIFRIAEAQAKLNFSDTTDDEIANQVMDSLGLMYLQYGKVIKKISNPRDVSVQSFYNILKQSQVGLTIKELTKIACEENKQISEYLGNKWRLDDNSKLKSVIDILTNKHEIKIVQQKPFVLQYISESEEHQESIKAKNHENITESSNPKDKLLSDVYDEYDVDNKNIENPDLSHDSFTDHKVNEDNDISNISNSTQTQQQNTKNGSHASSNLYPKDTVDKIKNIHSTSYTSYTSDRVDRIGPIHRKYARSDTWVCDNCNYYGDIHFMEIHPCKNIKKRC